MKKYYYILLFSFFTFFLILNIIPVFKDFNIFLPLILALIFSVFYNSLFYFFYNNLILNKENTFEIKYFSLLSIFCILMIALTSYGTYMYIMYSKMLKTGNPIILPSSVFYLLTLFFQLYFLRNEKIGNYYITSLIINTLCIFLFVGIWSVGGINGFFKLMPLIPLSLSILFSLNITFITIISFMFYILNVALIIWFPDFVFNVLFNNIHLSTSVFLKSRINFLFVDLFTFTNFYVLLGVVFYLNMKYLKKKRDEIQLLNIKIQSELDKNEREIKIASALQNNIMQYTNASFFDKYEISIYQKQSHGVGGDFFNIIRTNDNDYIVILLDVCGHDISTSMIIFYLKSLIDTSLEFYSNFLEFIKILNNKFKKFLKDHNSDLFAESSFVKLGESIQVTAGGCSFYIVNKDFTITAGNLSTYIGVSDDIDLSIDKFYIHNKDVLFMFTDGFLENSRLENSKQLLEKYINIIRDNLNFPLDYIKRLITEEYNNNIKENIELDDVTFLLIRKL